MSELNQQQNAPQQPAESQTQTGLQIDFTELLYRIVAHWKLIVLTALVGTLLGTLYSNVRKVTPIYQATATIYIVSRDSVVNVSDLSLGVTLTQDYIRIFKMWELHERVISRLNLPYTYTQMNGMISVVNASNTHMLDITATTNDPMLSQQLANTYAELGSEYIAETMSVDKPNIMSVALTPTNPINGGSRNFMLIGLIGGIFVGCGIVFIMMLMDDKVKSVEDIKKITGLNNLAIIPMDKNASILPRNSTNGKAEGNKRRKRK